MAKQFLIALLIIIVAGGAYFWWQGNSTPQEEAETPTSDFGPPAGSVMEDGVIPDASGDQTPGDNQGAPMTATVTYSTSFSPATVTIKKGGTVTFTSGTNMWVASAQHPTHTAYADSSLQEHCPDTAGVAFDQCESGTSYSFTFNKMGTWKYHNHLNASAFGSVVVVE